MTYKSVKEFLAEKSRWSSYWFAADKNGQMTTYDGDDAVKWSLEAAIYFIYRYEPERQQAIDKITKVIGHTNIGLFNDSNTYEIVYKAICEAGI